MVKVKIFWKYYILIVKMKLKIFYIFYLINDRNACNKLEKEIFNDSIQISYKVLNKKQFITKNNINENNKYIRGY